MLTNNLRDISTLVTLDYVDCLARQKLKNKQFVRNNAVRNGEQIFILQLFREIYTFQSLVKKPFIDIKYYFCVLETLSLKLTLLKYSTKVMNLVIYWVSI